jgi:hypothetical protein
MDVSKTCLIINLFLNHPATSKSVEKKNQNNNGYGVWYSKNFLRPFVIIESQKGKEKEFQLERTIHIYKFFSKSFVHHSIIVV